MSFATHLRHLLPSQPPQFVSDWSQRVKARLLMDLALRLSTMLPKEPLPPLEDPQCLNGGLTLIPMPGHEETAKRVKEKIESGSIAAKQQRRTAVEIALPEFGTHANGEPRLALSKEHIGGHDCMVIASGPGTFQMIVQLLLLLWYVAGRGARRITVILSYCPLSRSDKDEGELILALAPFVLSLITFICGERLSKIIAVDLHANQIVLSAKPGTITEVKLGRRLLKQVVGDALREGRKIVLAFPDDSAKKRYEKIVPIIEQEYGIKLPIVIAAKRRTDSEKSEIEYLIGDVDALPGATVIMCDDEVATAGTNINAATVFMSERFRAYEVWSLVIHGVLCGKAVKNLMAEDCPLKRLYITDTIPISPRQEQLEPLISSGRLHVVEWTADLAWVIYQHHWSDSIRELR